jgi:formate dehydrogenase iron-sulfur subunit
MIACPWEIPRYSWEDSVPYIQKCHMCYDRVRDDGKPPACVEACPTQATIFGDRDELLTEARRRLAGEPDKYIQKIWGEREVGGTSVLYISDVDINLADLPDPVVDEEPMPHRTTKILHQMPLAFSGMAFLMVGVHWVIKRRQQLMTASNGMEPDGAEVQEPTEEGAPTSHEEGREGGPQ